MTSIFEVLHCRRPSLNYVCPPVCEVLFSGSGFPVIVLGDFSSLAAPGGVRFGGFGGFRLSWNRYPEAICYNVYRAETDDPNAPLVLVSECVTDTDIPLPPGCYRISAITPDGETALSPAVCYFVPPMLPPEVTTMAASDVLATQATLNGIINAIGQSSTAYFEWGTTVAYGNTTSVQNTGDTFADVPFNAVITGLAPNGLYHYRAIGFNGSGEGDGVDMTFITTNGEITFWNLTWALITEQLSNPGVTLDKTLEPAAFFFDYQQPPGSGGYFQYEGSFSYTGPARNAHLHLVITNSVALSEFETARIFISVGPDLVVDLNIPDTNTDGIYDFNFSIPASVSADIVVGVNVIMDPGDTKTLTWEATLTDEEA